jgi:hypothetical protein
MSDKGQTIEIALGTVPAVIPAQITRPDGTREAAEITIDRPDLRRMVLRAARNKSRCCQGGPVLVRMINARTPRKVSAP